MARRKKNNNLQVMQENKEVPMTEETAVLENPEVALNNMETEVDLARKELERVKAEIEEKQAKLKRLERREISAEERAISEKQVSTQVKGNALKEKIEKQKAFDNVMVTGRFYNLRAPGQSVKLPYLKYEDDPVKLYPFEHGKVYTIPRGFADQLNGGTENDPCYYTPKFIQKQGEYTPSSVTGENSQIAAVDTSNKKYSFVPLNF